MYYFMKQKTKQPLRAALSLLIAAVAFLGAADYGIDDTISLRTDAPLPSNAFYSVEAEDDALAASTGTECTYVAKLFGTVPLKTVSVSRFGNIRLCPGGMPFGAKMFTDGLIVVGFSEVDCESGSKQPAYDAGIRMHDVILKINGEPLASAAHMSEIVSASDGKPMTFTVRRSETELEFTLAPTFSVGEQTYKTGLWVRDNTAGIGTVTYIDPTTGAFAGLGHGICDGETGALLPLSRGMIANVSISGVRRGTSGTPGELKGYFSSGKIGALLGNTSAGVYGILSDIPNGVSKNTSLPIALKDEIHDGKAQIYCTLDENGIKSYEVTIRKIKNATDNKCMEVTVTDPALIEITGGIVQGMSGSPIIQDGRLIGAVTHVLISDPTKGYGIFIENMLEAAE